LCESWETAQNLKWSARKCSQKNDNSKN
jgi:hypothetical protein